MKPRKNQSAWDALKEAQAERVIRREEDRVAELRRRVAEDAELRRRVKAQVQKQVSPFQKLVDLFRKRRDEHEPDA